MDMETESKQLDDLQAAYHDLAEQWIAAIREEIALASTPHSVAEVDKWEAAFFRQDELREQVKAAKAAYEDALREEFFEF